MNEWKKQINIKTLRNRKDRVLGEDSQNIPIINFEFMKKFWKLDHLTFFSQLTFLREKSTKNYSCELNLFYFSLTAFALLSVYEFLLLLISSCFFP